MAGWNPTAGPQALPKVSGAQGNPAGSPGGTPGGPSATTSAKGWAGKNRTTLLAAGAGGVVLLALVMKNRAGATTASQDPAAGTLTTNPQNLAAYDSSSSDVYNALQPQLEAIQDLLTEWGTGKGAESTVPVPGSSIEVPTGTIPIPGVPATVSAAVTAAQEASRIPSAAGDFATIVGTSGSVAQQATSTGQMTYTGTNGKQYTATSTGNIVVDTNQSLAKMQSDYARLANDSNAGINRNTLAALALAIQNKGGTVPK